MPQKVQSKRTICIRLNSGGYFGNKPWVALPIQKAIIFETMRKARKQLNRLRKFGYDHAEIEVKEE